jgi:hypothetical protein
MIRRALIAFALLTPAAAGAQSPQFLKLNDTLEVEVHGLRTWTAERLNDTLGRISPGLSLASHACAAVMRRFLGFADAEVAYHPHTAPRLVRIVVTAIEPGDSARVRRLASPTVGRPVVARWSDAVTILRREFVAMFPLQVPAFLRGATDSVGTPLTPVSAAALRLRDEIRQLTTPQDLEDALAVLRDDSTAMHRITAIWVLTGFPNEPRAWGALLDAARAARPMGYETWALAAMVPPWGDGSVDLRPHEETLAAILGGTGLFQTIPTMRLLASLTLDPAMARRLAVAGRDLLLSNLQSRETSRREAARGFLERASGERHGLDVEAWRRWLQG